MARDPLRVLQAIRRRLVEQARYALGECLKAEAEVADRIAVLDDAVRRRPRSERGMARGSSVPGDVRDPGEVNASGAPSYCGGTGGGRCPFGRSAPRRHRCANGGRSGGDADGERAAASQAEGIRREQHVLDDIARALRAVRQSGGNS